MTFLSSKSNGHIKYIKALQERNNFRKSEGRFVVEGKRELMIALQSGYELEKIFIVPLLFDIAQISSELIPAAESFEVDKNLYQHMAYRASTEGIMGIFRQKNHSIKELTLKRENTLVIVLESIEKPGNLGAIFRTADAAKVDVVCLANSTVDLYNPNSIRSSLGCCLSVPCIEGSNQEVLDWLEASHINTYAATLQNSNIYHKEDYRKASAFIMGSEANGLSAFWRTHTKTAVTIPMLGLIDSMNVSVATAVLTFEALRQRSG
ncbi:MAG: RNA methyltransferase [Bacteroidetes bacterium]|nr:RNA methyltransferase [Bacteroidota bacterium]MDA0950080.1 RNA methyltransferase [Bacteroidota bacterium]